MGKSVVDLQESSSLSNITIVVDISNNTSIVDISNNIVDLIDTMADNVSTKKPSLFRFDCLGCSSFSYKSSNAVIEPVSEPEPVSKPESIFEPSSEPVSEPLIVPLSIIDSEIESTDSSNPKSILETATQI